MTGTVNGQSGGNAAQFVSVTQEGSGPFTMNGAARHGSDADATDEYGSGGANQHDRAKSELSAKPKVAEQQHPLQPGTDRGSE